MRYVNDILPCTALSVGYRDLCQHWISLSKFPVPLLYASSFGVETVCRKRDNEQIHHILCEFCSLMCENWLILCNFAVAFRKECKDILLNRLLITTWKTESNYTLLGAKALWRRHSHICVMVVVTKKSYGESLRHFRTHLRGENAGWGRVEEPKT